MYVAAQLSRLNVLHNNLSLMETNVTFFQCSSSYLRVFTVQHIFLFSPLHSHVRLCSLLLFLLVFCFLVVPQIYNSRRTVATTAVAVVVVSASSC